MYKTKNTSSSSELKLAVTTEELASMLSCGVGTAKEIGEKSGARLNLSTRRTLWSVEKVREYIVETAC